MDYRLSVDRGHLLCGLKLTRKLTRRTRASDRAVFGFDGSFMSVEVADIMFLSFAVGAWPGNATTSASLVMALAKELPPGDPIIVTCDGASFCFGPLRVGCVWQPMSRALLKPRVRREWIESIALKYTMPRGRIIADGLGSELKAAEQKLDALVRKVARSLAPVGVTTEDVRALIERRLAERYLGPELVRQGMEFNDGAARVVT